MQNREDTACAATARLIGGGHEVAGDSSGRSKAEQSVIGLVGRGRDGGADTLLRVADVSPSDGAIGVGLGVLGEHAKYFSSHEVVPGVGHLAPPGLDRA